jgi:hypothetical protein
VGATALQRTRRIRPEFTPFHGMSQRVGYLVFLAC